MAFKSSLLDQLCSYRTLRFMLRDSWANWFNSLSQSHSLLKAGSVLERPLKAVYVHVMGWFRDAHWMGWLRWLVVGCLTGQVCLVCYVLHAGLAHIPREDKKGRVLSAVKAMEERCCQWLMAGRVYCSLGYGFPVSLSLWWLPLIKHRNQRGPGKTRSSRRRREFTNRLSVGAGQMRRA